ncbi:glutamate synthase subunit beta [Aureibacillus halotolerans]|uniref:Glutamate synthase (NADPH) small subunit n=1 Tax=Aureibacillus halotolerans TaxID=1508390 RepID=A0A4R6U0G3_9BACI|nr:glutamate synthase subunit beta [Aureibacillus halotolerans]TDQ39760.1 glutamate synthase (NADPH) small subunit [Aureibacillus halotolerans]
MGKPTGFMDYQREKPKERDPVSRLNDWKEYQLPYEEKTLKQQGARCMDCGTPFCHTGIEIAGAASGCPLYNLIPEWNDLVYRGRWKEALDRLLKTNNFPEFTGRVCPAPCEGSCTVAINDPAVAIKSIERSIIDKGFEEGWMTPQPPSHRSGKHVAIIGSGPAGLAAADQLNKAGHFVTVYEKSDRIGGLLMYGIPNMKLEKRLIERRVELMEAEGVTFVANTEIGTDLSMDQVKADNDAVILAIGALKQREIDLENREADGVHLAMDYLTQNTKSLLDSNHEDQNYISAEGKDVIVIGGGDTGADCVATAVRQNCNSVVQFGKYPQLPYDRINENPWPQQPQVFSLDYAYEEAKALFGNDPREYAIMTKRFEMDENGKLKALHTVQSQKEVDENGRVTMREIPGSEKAWPAQLVFVAIGFEGPEEELLSQMNLERGQRNTVKAEYGTYTTNEEGVFAAGDVRRGQSLIVWAIHEGREAARECDRFLMGSTVLP